MTKKPLYRKSLREQIEGKCIHFNGLMNDVCKAGVRYAQFRTPTPGESPYMFPCHKDRGASIPCDKRKWPSEEHVQARLDEIEESTQRHMKAGAVVKDFRTRNKGKSAQEVVDCPACGTGKLHLSISSYNGHVWGRCTTENCLAWME